MLKRPVNQFMFFLIVLVCFAVSSSFTLGAVSAVDDLTFDNLKFEMEKTETFERTMLTSEIKSLDGQQITIRGYIRPNFRQSGITKFVLVRDNQECCFGPGAAIYDCVLVMLDDDVEIDYTVRPITVQGDFYIKEFKGPDGKIWAIYRMKHAVVK